MGWSAGPDEPAVLIPLCQDTDEARLAIKYFSYVLWCDARIAPCGGDGKAHLVFRGMSCACVRASDAGYCAAGGFVEGALLDRRILGVIVKLNRGEAGSGGAGGLHEGR